MSPWKEDKAALWKSESTTKFIIPFAVQVIDYEAQVSETFPSRMLQCEICEISIEESRLNIIM